MISLLESKHAFLDSLNEWVYFPERKLICSELATECSMKHRTLIPISDTFLLLYTLFSDNKNMGASSPSWFVKVGPIYTGKILREHFK